MLLAITICIISGFIIGALQLIRLDIIDIMWEIITPFTPEYDTPELAYEKTKAWVLIICLTLVALAVILTEPWAALDNFTADKKTALALDIALKIGAVIVAVLAGEYMVPRLNLQKRMDAHAEEYFKSHKADVEPKAPPRPPHDWDTWRKEQSHKRNGGTVPPYQDRSSHHKYQGRQQKASSPRHHDDPRRNALRILKLSSGATQTQIRKAYIKMAKAYHPDRVLTPDSSPQSRARAESKMKTINVAYDWLKNNS